MAVNFYEVPDEYSSVFSPLVYRLSGIAAGETVEVAVARSGDERPLGMKRIVGGDGASVNISGYVRRCLSPSPFPADILSLDVDEGRCVTVLLAAGGAVSAGRTYTCAAVPLSYMDLLTAMPDRRRIAWDESDEISVLPGGGALRYRWKVTGTGGAYEYESEDYDAPFGIVSLAFGMPAVAAALAGRGLRKEDYDVVEVDIVRLGESIARVVYDIAERPEGAVRLCWLNVFGGFDYHTFGTPSGEYLVVERSDADYADTAPRFRGRWRRQELTSGYMPRAWIEALAGITASPLVWRVDEEGFIPVNVQAGEIPLRSDGLNAVSFSVSDGVRIPCQNF